MLLQRQVEETGDQLRTSKNSQSMNSKTTKSLSSRQLEEAKVKLAQNNQTITDLQKKLEDMKSAGKTHLVSAK